MNKLDNTALNLFGEELTRLNESINLLEELVNQIKEDQFLEAERYYPFFSKVYYAIYDQVIFGFCRLCDKSKDSESITRALIQIQKECPNATKVLSEIENHNVLKKLISLRNKLGRAHNDKYIYRDKDKFNAYLKKNATIISDLKTFHILLQKAWEYIASKLDNPIHYIYCDSIFEKLSFRKLCKDLKLFRNYHSDNIL